MTAISRTIAATLACTLTLSAANLPAQFFQSSRPGGSRTSAGYRHHGDSAYDRRHSRDRVHGDQFGNHNGDIVQSRDHGPGQGSGSGRKPREPDYLGLGVGILNSLLDSQHREPRGPRYDRFPDHGPRYVPQPVIIPNPTIVRREPIMPYVPPVVRPPRPIEPTIVPVSPNVRPEPKAPLTAALPPVPAMPPIPAKPKNNGAPQFNMRSGSFDDARNAASAVEDEATKALDALFETLPNTPEIKTLKEAAENAIKEGKSLDKTWQAQLQTAVAAAGGAVDPAEANRLVKLIPGLIEANKVLAGAASGGGGGGGGGGPSVIPTGPIPMVIFPQLVAGMMMSLPGGVMVVGTGGQGSIQVVTADAASVLGVPLGVGAPLPDAPTTASLPTGRGVLLRNPADNGAVVAYLLDSRFPFTLSPDFTQELNDGAPHEIRFDRGAGGGEAAYQLMSGTYAFAAGSGGWDLFKEMFSVTIDNSAGTSDFHYVVENRRAKVAAGQSLTHKSDYPIVLRFNRGDAGAESVKHIATNDERLTVAVNPADGLWDLYSSDSVPAMNLPPNMVATSAAPSPVFAQPQPEGRLLSVLKQAGAKF